MVRRKQTYTSINPALFLTQALRSLEEAQKLETTAVQANEASAFQLYSTLVQTFQTVFGIPGVSGQERIRPLNDRHLTLQLAHVARDAREGFNRTHNSLPIHVVVNIRSGYYPSPSYPADVDAAITWLEYMASNIQQMQDIPTPEVTGKGKGKRRGSLTVTRGSVQLLTNTTPTVTPVVPTVVATSPPVEATPPPVNAPTTCLVCADEFSYADTPPADAAILPKRAPTERCAHPPGICTSCLSQTIAATMDAYGAAQPIRCPDAACTESMSRDDVKTWASDDTFARWDMLSLRELMRADSTTNPDGGLFIWCQNPSCYSGQLHPQGDAQPMVTCIRCSEKTCFTHSTMWHEGQTCKQYDRSRPVKDLVNRGVSRAAIWWRTRKCPGCFQPISKAGGCRHISCRCGYHFGDQPLPVFRPIAPGGTLQFIGDALFPLSELETQPFEHYFTLRSDKSHSLPISDTATHSPLELISYAFSAQFRYVQPPTHAISDLSLSSDWTHSVHLPFDNHYNLILSLYTSEISPKDVITVTVPTNDGKNPKTNLAPPAKINPT